MARPYTHLTLQERCMIAALLAIGKRTTEIAERLGRSRSTIRDEVTRGRERMGAPYDAAVAHQRAQDRRPTTNAKRLNESTWAAVLPLLELDWSPEQIANRIRPQCEVSHTSIYRWLAADRRRGGRLHRMLRHGRPYRKRHTRESRGRIVNRRDIDTRPAVVDRRERVGDWELDLVIGGDHRGAIISVNERVTGIALQRWVPSKDSSRVADGVIALLWPLREFVHTITSDNGHEFAGHERVSRALEADFYFARPHAPWQRGANENTNGLIRQYFPKGSSMGYVPEWRIYNMLKRLNERPRKRLGYRTPIEVFAARTGLEYAAAAELLKIQ
ncbi:IS30 family transposase [Chitiniphilus eburneus]|uniref:IS30 family transposase n=1 Tax=Chitiniphilus eburneus TaxID=2571148 RepID=UPI0035CF190B